MTRILMLALTLIPMMALAGGRPPPPQPEQDQQQKQMQGQDQNQGQDQTQDQSQMQEANANNTGNTQVVNFSSPDDVTIRNTASANPPSVFGSHSCATGGSAGVGVPAFNISGGRQKIDPACVAREEARLLHAFGERELAVTYLCLSSASLQQHLGEACGPSVTQEELRRRIDYILDEKAIADQKCEESKDRILEGCYK